MEPKLKGIVMNNNNEVGPQRVQLNIPSQSSIPMKSTPAQREIQTVVVCG